MKDQRAKVCRKCRLFVDGTRCPQCNESNFSHSWKGIIFINDPNGSEIAQKLEITKKGKYCIWVK